MATNTLSQALIQVRLAELLPAWQVDAWADPDTGSPSFRCSTSIGGVTRDSFLALPTAELDLSLAVLEARWLQPFASALNRSYQEIFDGLVKIEARVSLDLSTAQN